MKRLLIANRGEIAIRIARAATELGIQTVSVYSEDDAASLHVRRADASQLLPGAGARAYLDIDAVLAAAKAAGCDAIHPEAAGSSSQLELACSGWRRFIRPGPGLNLDAAPQGAGPREPILERV